MKIGKLPNDVLQKIIIDKISHTRNDILVRPQVGVDCCAIDFGENVCVLSSDPVTGSVNDVGRLAVHVSCNDLATFGVEPIGLMATILVPTTATTEDIEKIMSEMVHTASELGVEIVGGHTEVTDAVSKIVVITTGVGKTIKENLVSTNKAKPNDKVIVTKYCGLEGTAIIASDLKDEVISTFGEDFTDSAISLFNNVSVVKEGLICAKIGVNSMHDITEGGVLGSAWEIAEASGLGIRIYEDQIPILETTKKICNHYNIDPLRLISSGSMMVTASEDKVNKVIDALREEGIPAHIIGEITENKDKVLITEEGEKEIKQPESDHLYKVIK